MKFLYTCTRIHMSINTSGFKEATELLQLLSYMAAETIGGYTFTPGKVDSLHCFPSATSSILMRVGGHYSL